MVHSLLSMTDNDHSSEKSFSSWSSSVDRPFSGHGSTSSPGSCHSVSTETAYPREYNAAAMPTVRPASQQQQPPPQQIYPYYFHPQGTNTMFARPPPPAAVSEPAMLTQMNPGQRMMNPADLEFVMNPDMSAVSQNGSGYPTMPKDGHFEQFGAVYGAARGNRGFLAQEQMGPPTVPHSQAYFRIGQPYSFGNSVGPQLQRNVVPMYIARQEDPSSRPMPVAMGMMPPQPLQWSRQPLMPQGVPPYMPYSSLSEPPPKLSQPLPEEYALATFPQTPASMNLGIHDAVNSAGRQAGKPVEHGQYLLPPGAAGARFPAPTHFQQDPVNGADRMPWFPHLGCREMDPSMAASQFGGQPGIFGIQRNGVHLSDILDNIPTTLGSSQSSGLFQVENRIPDDLDRMPRSPDQKVVEI